MKKIGLVVAVEVDALKTLYGAPKSEFRLHGMNVMEYVQEGYELIVVHCGMGTIASTMATTLLIDRFEVSMIVNFGLVGALTEEIAKTPIVFVSHVIDSEMDVGPIDGLPLGVHEGFDSPLLPLDGDLLKKGREANPDFPTAICVSGNQFLEGETKRKARETFHGDICDMELAGIAYAAYADRVPVLSMKIVSDNVFEGGKEYYQVKEKASLECLKALDKIMPEILKSE